MMPAPVALGNLRVALDLDTVPHNVRNADVPLYSSKYIEPVACTVPFSYSTNHMLWRRASVSAVVLVSRLRSAGWKLESRTSSVRERG